MLRMGSLEIIFHVSSRDFEVILLRNIELKINCPPLLETNRSCRPRVKQKSKYWPEWVAAYFSSKSNIFGYHYSPANRNKQFGECRELVY